MTRGVEGRNKSGIDFLEFDQIYDSAEEIDYVTSGVVSDMIVDTYLTDAAVNEANSGGPMSDSQGRVLGIASHGPIMANLYEQNQEGIFDRAEGIAVFQRLRLACEHLFEGTPVCPYEN